MLVVIVLRSLNLQTPPGHATESVASSLPPSHPNCIALYYIVQFLELRDSSLSLAQTGPKRKKGYALTPVHTTALKSQRIPHLSSSANKGLITRYLIRGGANLGPGHL